MKTLKMYEAGDKMVTLMRDNYHLLQVLESFGIHLGFGDKSVREMCEANAVDTYTFLAVVNYTINGHYDYDDDPQLDVPTLLHYLEASHTYFLDFQLPSIRQKLGDCLAKDDALGHLIMKSYDDYAREVQRHMRYEEKTLFPYVESLLRGEAKTDYNVDTFSRHHEATDRALAEIKLMIIKYLPSDGKTNNRLMAALYDIYNNEEWLRNHAHVEDRIFTPAIRRLERQLKQDKVTRNLTTMVSKGNGDSGETLSDREREVIVSLVQGMANKEIADHLCISVNTVITHRRNIARKLQIHSPAGLTVYAIVNGLVDISSVKL